MVDLPDGRIFGHQSLFLFSRVRDVPGQEEGPNALPFLEKRDRTHRHRGPVSLHIYTPGSFPHDDNRERLFNARPVSHRFHDVLDQHRSHQVLGDAQATHVRVRVRTDSQYAPVIIDEDGPVYRTRCAVTGESRCLRVRVLTVSDHLTQDVSNLYGPPLRTCLSARGRDVCFSADCSKAVAFTHNRNAGDSRGVEPCPVDGRRGQDFLCLHRLG